MDISEPNQLGGDDTVGGEQKFPKRERLIWLTVTIGLVSILILSALFQSERLAVVLDAVDEQTPSLENLQNELIEISEISEDIERYRGQLDGCLLAVAQVDDEIKELEGELSTISLFTQGMWHNGARGMDRLAAIASIENFSVLAQSNSVEEAGSSCVS